MRQYTREEVSKHNKVSDCWVIVDSRVYDVTAFLESHPGGASRLLSVAGKDATDSFLAAQHTDTVLRQRGIQYEIGSIKGEKSVDSVPPFPDEDTSEKEASQEKHGRHDSGREFPFDDVDELDDRVSVISVHSNLPDSSPPAPDDHEEMSFENLRQMMPYGIPDAALHDEVARMHKAGIMQFGDLGVHTLQELEKIVRPATARTLRHYVKGSVRLSSPTMSQARPNHSQQADMTVGFLRPLLGGAPDLSLEEEVLKLRNRGVLHSTALAQFSMEDIERIVVKPATARALKPFLKSAQQLSLPPGSHFSSSDDKYLTLVFLRSLFPMGVPESALQEELNKMNHANVTTFGQLAQYSVEELGAIVKPATVRALGKYTKADLHINTDPKKLKVASSEPLEQPIDIPFLRTLLPNGVPDAAISIEMNALHNAGLMKVGDIGQKTSEELDKIVKLVTSKALKHLTKDGKNNTSQSRASLPGSRPSTSASASQEMNVAFLRSVLPDVSDYTLEEEVDKLRSASIVTVGDLDRFLPQDLEKIVHTTTVRVLKSLKRETENSQSGRELNTAFLATLMPGVPETALAQEVAKLQVQQITTVEQLEQVTVEDLERFGLRVAAVKALRMYAKGGTSVLVGMASPGLGAKGGNIVPGLSLDNWVPSSEITLFFLRSCMPGVPDGPLQEELNKLRYNKIASIGNLSVYTLEDMEKIVKSSTARAMARFLKGDGGMGVPLPPPRGILSPGLGGQAGTTVPSFALDSFPPFTEVNLGFLRRVLPGGIPDVVLQEELNKLRTRGITSVGVLSHFTLAEMEGIVKVGTARTLVRFLKDAPKGILSPVMRGVIPGEPIPALLLASIRPTTEITTAFLRPLLPESQSGAVQDEVLKLRSRNITTVGLLSNYSLQEMERIVLPLTARTLATFLKQAPTKAVVSPTLGSVRGFDSVPQLALEAKAPAWTDISSTFLRTVMPSNVPDNALQEEVFKLRQAGITTVGHLANYSVEELERIVRVPVARALPRYLKQSATMYGGGMLSPEQRAAQPTQLVSAFQLDRMRAAAAAEAETGQGMQQGGFPPHAEISLVLLKSVMPGVPDAPLNEELNKLRNRQIRTVGNLSFYTVEEMQSIVRPGTSRALLRYLKQTGGGYPTNIASPTMNSMQQPSAYVPNMSLTNNPTASNFPRVNYGMAPAPAPVAPVPVDFNQELSIAFLRTLLPAGVPDAALQEELNKLRENFILTVGNLGDYSTQDLEKILLKLGTIRALKLYVKGGTSASRGTSGSVGVREGVVNEGEGKSDGELTPQFLASVMPKGVPEAALHVELAKLRNQMVCTLYHLSFLTIEDMERIVRLTTARSLKEYLKGGSIQVPAPPPPPVKEVELPPDLPDGPPWTDKHTINVTFLRTVMPPGLPDEPLKDEVNKLKLNKIVLLGDLGKLSVEEITKLAGMSGWFLKDYAKEGVKCLYTPPPPYVPEPEINLAFMKTLIPPGMPDFLLQDEVNKLIAANIITVPDLGLKTTEELSKIVGMSGWFLKDYLKGGCKMLAPNPKPVVEEPKFTDGPEQELTAPFLKSVLPLGVPEEAVEEESKKLRTAGILNLGQLSQFTPRDIEGIARVLTVRALSKFLRPPQETVVSPILKQLSPTGGVTRNAEDEITVSLLRTVMPAGVPVAALQEEVGKLHAKGIWTIRNLSQYSLLEMEQIVRATTARSLKEYLLPSRRISTAVPRGGSPPSSLLGGGGGGEISVSFLRTVMPAGVPEQALLEEVGKLKSKGVNTIAQLATKTLAEMETIVRVTTARSLKDYLKPGSASDGTSVSSSPRSSLRTSQLPLGNVDWTKEDISLGFLRAMMPGLPDGSLQEEFNSLRNKAILRVNQLQQFTDYELGQIVRAGTVRALKNYLRGGGAFSSTPTSTMYTATSAAAEVGASTEITVSVFRSLMPGVPEGPLQDEIAKLRNRGIMNFGGLSSYTLEDLNQFVKPGIARALTRFLKPSNPNPAAALAPPPPPPPPPPSSSSSSSSSRAFSSDDSSHSSASLPPPSLSPYLSASQGSGVSSLSLPSASIEINLSFLRQAMPGVPDAALQDELNKLQSRNLASTSALSQYTAADLETIGLRTASIRALKAHLRP